MNFNDYQKFARRTMDEEWTTSQKSAHALHGISAECGEIHSIYQKSMQGHKFTLENLQEEIGDLLWFIAELATSYDLRLEDIAQHNIDKLKKRYPDGFDAERSVHREV